MISPPPPLTTREKEILALVATGKTTKEIARELKLSVHTIATHRKHLCKKLGLHSTVELALCWAALTTDR